MNQANNFANIKFIFSVSIFINYTYKLIKKVLLTMSNYITYLLYIIYFISLLRVKIY